MRDAATIERKADKVGGRGTISQKEISFLSGEKRKTARKRCKNTNLSDKRKNDSLSKQALVENY